MNEFQEFQCFDWNSEDFPDDEGKRWFTIYGYGLTREGKSVAVHITDYEPYFYVSIPHTWKLKDCKKFINELKWHKRGTEDKRPMINYKARDELIEDDLRIVHKCRFEGFTDSAKYPFLKLTFETQNASRAFSSCIKDYTEKKNLSNNITLFESTLDPMLRFFHDSNIEPSGWVKINTFANEVEEKLFNTDLEYSIDSKNIFPVQCDDMTPLKIASYDIECDSSHGDFPLPKKDLRKLVCDVHQEYNRVRILFENNKKDVPYFDCNEARIYYIVSMFILGFHEPDDEDWKRDKHNISEVFTKYKRKPTEEELKSIISPYFDIDNNLLLFQEIKGPKKEKIIQELVGQQSVIWDNPPGKYFQEKYTDYEDIPIWVRKKFKCKRKITGLHNLDIEVEGDPVIQIGTVFYKLGDPTTKMERTIVTLGTCDDIPGCDVLISCDTEAEVLIAWSKLIREKNPQYITGYNIFGFDFKYVWDRAKELKIHDNPDFAELGIRNDRNSDLKHKQLTSSALGDNSLHFIDMDGRVLFDLQKEVQKEHNLASYKLDNVAAEFMRGNITRNKPTKERKDKQFIFTNDIGTLTKGKYIKIVEYNSIGEQFYEKGKKFKIRGVHKKQLFLIVEGEFTMKPDYKYKWCEAKDDISPQDIFRKQKEGSKERAEIAKYCIQDCELCIHLIHKFENIIRNMSMGNVCYVPNQFIYLRGQGVKIFSLVAKTASNYPEGIGTLIKTKNNNFDDDDKIEQGAERDAFEGAIVLEPNGTGKNGGGIYIDEPVAVMDFASLYPSSMMERNLSHETIVTEKMIKNYPENYIIEDKSADKTKLLFNGKTFNVTRIVYENYFFKYEGKTWKKYRHTTKPNITCWFVQNNVGIIPHVVGTLLKNRKATKNELKNEKDPERKKVLDGKQLSYKLTANSTYGQIGAKTSQLYLQEIAACTTATGREHIMTAKSFVEDKFVGSKVVYGDTDSIFVNFSKWIHEHPDSEYKGLNKSGLDLVDATIKTAQKADELFTEQGVYDKPQHLEYEKTFWPFIQISKKRYTGDKYEFDTKKSSRTSMGLVTKRRDNAPIVKYVFGTIVEIIMKDKDIDKAVKWLKGTLMDIAHGKFDMNMFIVSKTLRGHYKNPLGIAHKVLADRMTERDPGNKPASNDRIPYAYIESKEAIKLAKEEKKPFLQGDRIEHPDYITDKNLKIDYSFYITNQIQVPVSQILELQYSEKETDEFFNESLDFIDPETTLSKLSVDGLKKLCTDNKLIYKKTSKSNLIKHLLDKGNPEYIDNSNPLEEYYKELPVTELKSKCKEHGLITKGKKSILITYLLDKENPEYKDNSNPLEDLYLKKKMIELKELCENKGLDKKGKKIDLITRLLEHQQENQATQNA